MWWDRSAQYNYVSICYYRFFRCLFSGICVCLIMRAGHVVEMSTWTKAIIAASAVIIMVHWYCRTTNVYLHFCIYCYNASHIMEENIISWNRVMSMRCCIFKSHIFIIHIILEKLLPAFGIIYNSYKSYNDWKFNFVWVTAMPINIPGTYTPRALVLMRLKYDWHVVLMFNFLT